MLTKMLATVSGRGRAARSSASQGRELPARIREYLADSYPSNHNYEIVNGKPVASKKLAKRYETMKKLFPRPLTSLLDVGCSKGFFVINAAQQSSCERALGIDIQAEDLEACNAVKDHLNVFRSRFEFLRLHELADRIDEFGGPFQTVLLINTYQYLYFGGPRSLHCYSDHRSIFQMIRRVCSGRLIFNNRTEFVECQSAVQDLGREAGRGELYSSPLILEAAATYFDVKPQGEFGRYPLWTMDARRAA